MSTPASAPVGTVVVRAGTTPMMALWVLAPVRQLTRAVAVIWLLPGIVAVAVIVAAGTGVR